MCIVVICLPQPGGVDDLLLQLFRKPGAQLRIYILCPVLNELYPEGFYFLRNGGYVFEPVFAACIVEDQEASKQRTNELYISDRIFQVIYFDDDKTAFLKVFDIIFFQFSIERSFADAKVKRSVTPLTPVLFQRFDDELFFFVYDAQ